MTAFGRVSRSGTLNTQRFPCFPSPFVDNCRITTKLSHRPTVSMLHPPRGTIPEAAPRRDQPQRPTWSGSSRRLPFDMRATALKKATRTGRVRHLHGANYVLGRKTASPQGLRWAVGGRMAPFFPRWPATAVAKFSRGGERPRPSWLLRSRWAPGRAASLGGPADKHRERRVLNFHLNVDFPPRGHILSFSIRQRARHNRNQPADSATSSPSYLPRTLRHALWPSLAVRPLRGPVAYPQPGAERGFRLSTPHRYYPFKTSKTTPSVDIS
jgi:hypothetical protein